MNWFKNSYSEREWLILRAGFIVVWLPLMLYILFYFKDTPTPAGLARYINLNFITHPISVWILTPTIVALSWLYIKGVNLFYTSLTMLILGICVFTIHESQGGNQRNEIVHLILLGQFLAFFYHKYFAKDSWDSSKLRNIAIRNSVEMIAAIYFVSAISKLQISGLDWVLLSPNISVQVFKAQFSNYYSIDFFLFKFAYTNFPNLITNNPFIVKLGFAISLILELFAFMGLASKKIGFVVGVLLLLFNLAIFVLLGVLFIPFVYFIVLFFVLPYMIQTKAGVTGT